MTALNYPLVNQARRGDLVSPLDNVKKESLMIAIGFINKTN